MKSHNTHEITENFVHHTFVTTYMYFGHDLDKLLHFRRIKAASNYI